MLILRVERSENMKDKHIKVTAFSQGIVKPIIFFNKPELYDVFKNLGETTFSIVGTITQNEWNDTVSTEIIQPSLSRAMADRSGSMQN